MINDFFVKSMTKIVITQLRIMESVWLVTAELLTPKR